MAGARPGGVTLVAVVGCTSGAVNIIAGSLLVFAAIMAPDALWYGLVQLVLGIVTIVVSLGLLRGRPGVRIVVTVVFILNLISAVFVIFFLDIVRSLRYVTNASPTWLRYGRSQSLPLFPHDIQRCINRTTQIF